MEPCPFSIGLQREKSLRLLEAPDEGRIELTRLYVVTEL
jgi:hypothetical protein